MKQLKGELLYSALKNLSDAQIKCNIPTVDDFISCTKDNPLDWNAINNLQQSPNQPDTSFNEQFFLFKPALAQLMHTVMCTGLI